MVSYTRNAYPSDLRCSSTFPCQWGPAVCCLLNLLNPFPDSFSYVPRLQGQYRMLLLILLHGHYTDKILPLGPTLLHWLLVCVAPTSSPFSVPPIGRRVFHAHHQVHLDVPVAHGTNSSGGRGWVIYMVRPAGMEKTVPTVPPARRTEGGGWRGG